MEKQACHLESGSEGSKCRLGRSCRCGGGWRYTVRGGPRRLSERGLTKRGGSQESAGGEALAGGSAGGTPHCMGSEPLTLSSISEGRCCRCWPCSHEAMPPCQCRCGRPGRWL